MLPTVRQVLAMPILAAAEPEVIATDEQLGRPVRWLHPAEVAGIAPLLRGDEMVLLTGIALPETAVGMREYVESLVSAGSAGLVIELGRRWATLPEHLVQACQQLGLALVALHREIRFAAVVEEVGARILESEVEDLRASERIHEIFTRLDVDGATAQEILTAMVRLAAVPVVLESLRHQVIAYDAAGRPATEVLADWRRRSLAAAHHGRIGYDRRTGWLMTVVGSRGDDWGRLILMTDVPPARPDYVLLERAAAGLALHELRSRARDGIERNTHMALLAELRTGRLSSDTQLRCQALNFPLTGHRFIGIAMRPRITDATVRPASLTEIASATAAVSRSRGLPMLIGIDVDHVVLLSGFSPTSSVQSVLSTISREVRKTVDVVIACGEAVDRAEEADRTLLDAAHVLAAVDPQAASPWATLADVHLRGLLHLLRDDERVRTFARRELAPLVSYDHSHGTSLRQQLQVFLETPGGKAAAAKRLYLSRPVLYERLAKIEEILGVDLEDPYVRSSLQVALIVASLLADEVSASETISDSL